MLNRYARTGTPEEYANLLGGLPINRVIDEPGDPLTPDAYRLCALRTPKGKLKLGSAWWGYITEDALIPCMRAPTVSSEKAHEMERFSDAFVHRRCLIAATGWYTWERISHNQKRPWAARAKYGQPFFFAGLWSQAKSLSANHPAANRVTFAVMTADASGDLERIGSRQPVVLGVEAAQAWAGESADSRGLQAILTDGRLTGFDCAPVERATGLL